MFAYFLSSLGSGTTVLSSQPPWWDLVAVTALTMEEWTATDRLLWWGESHNSTALNTTHPPKLGAQSSVLGINFLFPPMCNSLFPQRALSFFPFCFLLRVFWVLAGKGSQLATWECVLLFLEDCPLLGHQFHGSQQENLRTSIDVDQSD